MRKEEQDKWEKNQVGTNFKISIPTRDVNNHYFGAAH